MAVNWDRHLVIKLKQLKSKDTLSGSKICTRGFGIAGRPRYSSSTCNWYNFGNCLAIPFVPGLP